VDKFAVYLYRHAFTASEAAALACGVIPTDELCAAIEGRAPASTEAAVNAREIRDLVRYGYERAVNELTVRLRDAETSADISEAIDAAHENGLVPFKFESWKRMDLDNFGRALSMAQFHAREAINDLESTKFHSLRFSRDGLASWFRKSEFASVYEFSQTSTPSEAGTPPRLTPAQKREIVARHKAGGSASGIAREYGVHRRTVDRILIDAGLKKNKYR
jgi:hypothetical protein